MPFDRVHEYPIVSNVNTCANHDAFYSQVITLQITDIVNANV